jgi:hypothetical protein
VQGSQKQAEAAATAARREALAREQRIQARINRATAGIEESIREGLFPLGWESRARLLTAVGRHGEALVDLLKAQALARERGHSEYANQLEPLVKECRTGVSPYTDVPRQ